MCQVQAEVLQEMARGWRLCNAQELTRIPALHWTPNGGPPEARWKMEVGDVKENEAFGRPASDARAGEFSVETAH